MPGTEPRRRLPSARSVTVAPLPYARARLLMSSERTLTDADVAALIGSEISCEMQGVQISRGVVSNAQIVEDGTWVQLTVEQGGRACLACGHVVAAADVDRLLVSVGELRAARPEGAWPVWRWDGLPDWTLVCRSDGDCTYRRMDDPPPNDGEPETPARFPDVNELPQDTCRHCGVAIHDDAVFWRHNPTGLIPCADNVKNATPAGRAAVS